MKSNAFYFYALTIASIFANHASSLSVKTKLANARVPYIPAERSAIIDPAAQIMLDKMAIEGVSVPLSISPEGSVASTYTCFEPANDEDDVQVETSSTGRIASMSISLESIISSFTGGGNSKRTSKKIAKKSPIVLLHGFDSSQLEFRRVAPLLAREREVYTPDILGWGFSEIEGVADFSPEAKMAHLRGFINDVVGGGPVVIVGASLGGGIALTLAAENPELVDKVVLIDAQGFIDGKGKSDLPDFLARAGINILKSQPLRMFANYLSYTDRKTFATWDAVNIGRLHCLIKGWDDAAVNFLKSGGFVLSDKVPRVFKDTLVIWGRNDEILEPSNAERFVNELPQCKGLKWIEDCGHVPHLEKAQETADTILEFLGDI